MVGGEVDSGRLHCHRCIGLIRWLGGDVFVYFHMHSQTKGAAYYVGDSGGGRVEKGSLRKL